MAFIVVKMYYELSYYKLIITPVIAFKKKLIMNSFLKKCNLNFHC